MRYVLRAAVALGCLAACGGRHRGYYEAPPHRRHDRYRYMHRSEARALPAVLRRAEAA